ncbi:MAG: hypothetical protein ACWGOV_01580 [Acidiferrobacterales bacterium]
MPKNTGKYFLGAIPVIWALYIWPTHFFDFSKFDTKDTLNILLTGALAYFAFQTFLINKRLAWFTGAMESHSELMMRIEAARGINGKPIPVIWWNPEPSEEEAFHTPHEHKEEAKITEIKLKVPISQRKQR